MTLQELLGLLQQNGIRLALEGQQMKVRAAKGALTDEIKALLVQHKTALMQWLVEAQAKQAKSAPIPVRDRSLAAPLSYAQQRLWFLDQLDPGSAAYNVPTALLLTGPLDIAALNRVFNTIVQRHEILRTSFETIDGIAVQNVHDIPAMNIDVRDYHGDTSAAALRELVRNEASKPFDLSKAPLLRVQVLRLDPKPLDASNSDQTKARWLLTQTLHHIITDGWSTGILMQEVIALYQAFAAHQPVPLPALPIQYADFASWQRATLSEQELTNKVAFWRDHLDGVASLDLPADRQRPPVRSGRGNTVDCVVDGATRDALQQLASGNGVTLFVVLLAAYAALLHRYTGQTDICIGTPIAGRTRAELQGLIGFFVNTLALRNDVTGNPTFMQLITRAQKIMLDATEHQDAPFESVVEAMNLPRDMSTTPLFQTVLVLQNAAQTVQRQPTTAPSITNNGLQVETLEASSATAKFDLTFNISDRSSDLLVGIEYDSDLFARERIARMGQHFANLLRAVVKNPELRVGDIEFLDTEERTRLLRWSAQTNTEYPKAVHLAAQFETVVAADPTAIALDFESEQVSYGALNRQASQLAHHLRMLGMQDRDNIAICVERSPQLITGIVAIIKANGAYVPLDPDYPDDRIAFMLTDTRARLIITTRQHAERLRRLADITLPPIVCLDDDAAAIATNSDNWHSTADNSNGEQLAYVMYTSGSTGMPKGVMVPQRGITRLVQNTNYIELDKNDVTGHISNVSFDAATLEIWGALLNGGRIAGISKDTLLNREKFKQALIDKRVSAMFITVTLFNLYVSEDASMFASVKNLLVGGEALDPNKIRAVLAANPPRRLLNGYGPTENTTFTCCHHIDHLDANATTVPLGRPLANTTTYVLDQYGRLAPIGVAGELVTGGDGVALGYLNRDDLNAQKFVDDTFAAVSSGMAGAKLYRTGDIVRWREDGAIEMLGRVDDQVKIRGFRIELGEIDAALGKLADVRECAVVVHADADNKLLVAYVVPQTFDAQSTLIARIKQQLAAALPQFMLPHAYVLLEKLPLTANGKLDRRALPAPDWSAQAASAYVAPTTATEHTLVKIWQDVLGVERIGIDDSFFELGGHSLLATRAIAAVQQQFNVSLPLRKLFENPTIAAIAVLIDNSQESSAPISPADRSRYPQLPLSQAQQRLWVVDQLLPGNIAYNMPVAARLRGVLDGTALQNAFAALQLRQASLRTSFAEVDGQAVQIVHDSVSWNLGVETVTAANTQDAEQQVRQLAMQAAARPFDLKTGPLWRANLYRLADDDHVLLVNIHHIISDGWSMDVMLREIGQLYAHFSSGNASDHTLPPLPIQYGDFSVWQREQLSGDVLKTQLDWWQHRLQGAPRLLALPTDHPRPPIQRYRGAQLPLQMPSQLVSALHAYCRTHNVTSYQLLLAAYFLLLARYCKQSDICIGTASAGRERAELQNLVGFFVNSLVLRGDVSGNPTVATLIARAREWALDAFDRQDVPFDLLVERLRIDRSLAFEPLRQVEFSLMAAPEQALVEQNFAGLQFEMLETSSGTAKADLTIALGERSDAIGGAIEYNTDLFERSTIETMARHYLHIVAAMLADPQQHIDNIELTGDGELGALLQQQGEHIEAIHSLSPMARDLFLDSLLEPDSRENSTGYFVELPDCLDVERWIKALQYVCDQHASLRSRLVQGSAGWMDVGYQIVDRQRPIHFTHYDWRDRIADIDAQRHEIESLSFYTLRELGDDLIRYGLIALANGRYVATFGTHHAIFDSKSHGVHYQHVLACYEALGRGTALPIFEDKLDELLVHKRQVTDNSDSLAYWRQKLASCDPLEPMLRTDDGGNELLELQTLPAELWRGIKHFCRQNDSNPADLLKTVLALQVSMLHQMSGDFRITDIMGTRLREHHETLGCYVQNVPCVVEQAAVAATGTVHQLLAFWRHHLKTLDALQNISVFAQKQIAGKQTLDYRFDYRDVGVSFDGSIDSHPCRQHWSSPLMRGIVQVIATQVGDSLQLRLHCYSNELHDSQFLQRLVFLLTQIVEGGSDLPLSSLQWVNAQERNNLLAQLAPASRQYPAAPLFHELFGAGAARHPQRIAVRHGNEQLDYAALNARCNAIAHQLQALGVGPDIMVGVCVSRGINMVIGALAIAKAGGAYVPIDPGYPEERIRFLLADTAAPVMLTESSLAAKLGELGAHCLCLDQAVSADNAAPVSHAGGNNLAYVIHTSGSTGTPKGVMIEHQAILQRFHSWNETYQLDQAPLTHLQLASMSFDVFASDLVKSLCAGGTLVICDKETLLDPAALFALMQREAIDFVEIVPAVMRQLAEYAQQQRLTLPALKYLVVGADAWFDKDQALVKRIAAATTRVFNSYGLTEAAVDSCYFTGRETDAQGQHMVPIGKPFPGHRMYIVDAQLRLLPASVAGELCVAEPGLARGYLNRPDLTATAFVDDPYQGSTRLYHSGDTVRLLDDGNIEFIGRRNNQIKIRGFRIELGEIEAAISALPMVRENVVLALDTASGKNLVAYVEFHAGQSADGVLLRQNLAQRLPPHMVPALLVVMDKMPVTPNGKLDRRALPAPSEDDYIGSNFVAPRNDIEQGLADLWCEVLGLGKVGVLDNFFHVGGHSLLAVKLTSRVRDQFQIDLPLTAIFEQPTIEQLALYIDSVKWTQQQADLPAEHSTDAVATSADREEFEL